MKPLKKLKLISVRAIYQRFCYLWVLLSLVACATRHGNAPVIDRSGVVPKVLSAPVTNSEVQAQSLDREASTASPSPRVSDESIDKNGLMPAPSAIPENSANFPLDQQELLASETIALAWPVKGPILDRFDERKNKGLNIGGQLGTPVRASAGGRVVYAGNGLRGYGNLVIIKHNALFLSAYAHNRALFVREGDIVTKGQKIADMGKSETNRVMLHFEVRRQGNPMDPLQYLPPQ